MRKLTLKQKEYARRRAKGQELCEAYKGAGYSNDQNDQTAKKNAWKLENTSASAEAIKAKIEELQRRADVGAVLSRRAKLGLLSDMALDSDRDDANRLRALDMLNRMEGDYNDHLTTEAVVRMSYADRLETMRNAQE